MFAYCRNNPIRRKDISGTTDVDIFDDNGSNILDEDKTYGGGRGGSAPSGNTGGNSGGPKASPGSGNTSGGGNGQTITLYRAVSPAEANSATSTQKFSPGGNSYSDSKFFATSQADAQKWGDFMYKDGNYQIISATFAPGVTSAVGVLYYSWHDCIGPAYLIPISELNASVVMICCV